VQTTTRRGISYPDPVRDDVPDIPLHLKDLADALDLDTPWYSGTFAARPAAGTLVTGSWYYATDTTTLYLNTGGSWTAIAPLASPAFTGTPTAPTPAVGDNSTKLATTAFVAAAIPTGSVMPFAGAAAPSGWLLADGSAVSRATYAALYAVIATTYGAGDGSTTFNVPDLRGRHPIGKNAGTFNTLAAVGGEETHVLLETEMPAHNHGGTTSPVSAGTPAGSISVAAETTDHTHSGTTSGRSVTHYHTFSRAIAVLPVTSGTGSGGQGVTWDTGNTSTETSDHTHSFTTGGRSAAHTHAATFSGSALAAHSHTISSDGGGVAHNNLSPYIVLNYIIKT
jgi:microcystin-dependent protein